MCIQFFLFKRTDFSQNVVISLVGLVRRLVHIKIDRFVQAVDLILVKRQKVGLQGKRFTLYAGKQFFIFVLTRFGLRQQFRSQRLRLLHDALCHDLGSTDGLVCLCFGFIDQLLRLVEIFVTHAMGILVGLGCDLVRLFFRVRHDLLRFLRGLSDQAFGAVLSLLRDRIGRFLRRDQRGFNGVLFLAVLFDLVGQNLHFTEQFFVFADHGRIRICDRIQKRIDLFYIIAPVARGGKAFITDIARCNHKNSPLLISL